ncbi:MAG: hypothetical protein DMD91_05640 [Candidatus Rokuibacteriota bacterium]|nr:MAG: hypothetical protein DMD91_05640 [Candidatus Rokubacteria bacterium]
MLDAALAKEQSLSAAIVSAPAQRSVAEAMLKSARAQLNKKEAARHQAAVDLQLGRIRPGRYERCRRRARVNEPGRVTVLVLAGLIAGDGHKLLGCWQAYPAFGVAR